MPQPIRPVHTLENHSSLFDTPAVSAEGISDLQAFLMGDTTVREASNKFSSQTLDLLQAIWDNVDDVLTAATAIRQTESARETLYRVPRAVSDYDLLALKAQGLIQGQGRTVAFTDTGRIAIRDRNLKEDNQFRANRAKTKFNLTEARENGTATRTSSQVPARSLSPTRFRKVSGEMPASE